MKSWPWRNLALSIGLILVGWLLAGAIRYMFMPDTAVHFHADFTVSLGGQTMNLTGPSYQEDASACSITNLDKPPRARSHLHDGVGTLVHVHDHSVTWGSFFQSIGYAIGDGYLVDGKGVQYPVAFLLNGEERNDIGGWLIRSEDVLLVSEGLSLEAQRAGASAIPRLAPEANRTYDPPACQSSRPDWVGKARKSLFW